MGDFNIIRYSIEKIGGDGFDLPAISKFQHCIEQIDVDDIPTKG